MFSVLQRWSPEALRLPRAWIDFFFSVAGLATFAVGFLMSRTARSWTLGLWLINYEGGFVRRGLPGEIFYLLGRAFHITPVFFLLTTCFIFYAILMFSVRSLALNSSRNLWLIALILSPATFWFQLLHPRNGFNKEIIFLAALSLFAVILSRTDVSSVAASLYLTVCIVIIVLSHEGLLFYAPYFFAVLVLGGRSVRRAAMECAIPAIAGLAVAWLCSRHNGTVEIATRICSSLGYPFNPSGSGEICSGGAITYLTRSTEYARADTLDSIRQYHFLLVFPCFAALALVPAVGESAVLVRKGISREVFVLWMAVFVSFLGTLVLFYYAYDWNRWIYIHIASITILLLLLDGRVKRSAGPLADAERRMPLKQQALCAAAIVIYTLLCIAPNTIQSLSVGFLKGWTHRRHVSVNSTTLHTRFDSPAEIPQRADNS